MLVPPDILLCIHGSLGNAVGSPPWLNSTRPLRERALRSPTETCLFFCNLHVPTHLAMELFFSAQHINILPLSHDTLLGNCPRNYNQWLHSQRTKEAAAPCTHETGRGPQLGDGLSLQLCPFSTRSVPPLPVVMAMPLGSQDQAFYFISTPLLPAPLCV